LFSCPDKRKVTFLVLKNGSTVLDRKRIYANPSSYPNPNPKPNPNPPPKAQ